MSPYPGPGGRQADDRQATGRRRTMASVMLWATFILEYIMSVQISVLTDTFAVAPQIDPGDIAEIAAAGFKSIIINRPRSEEHTSELQSLMRLSYAVFCSQKQTTTLTNAPTTNHNTHKN